MEGDLKPAGDSPDIGRQAGGGLTTMGGRIDLDSCGTAASSSMQGQGTQGNERNGGRIAKLGREERRPGEGLIYRPDRPNRRGPVPVYRSDLAGNRSVPVEVKFEFKILCANGSYRYTGRFDW